MIGCRVCGAPAGALALAFVPGRKYPSKFVTAASAPAGAQPTGWGCRHMKFEGLWIALGIAVGALAAVVVLALAAAGAMVLAAWAL